MLSYAIVDDKVVLRDHAGDVFTFGPAPAGSRPAMRLIGRPRWTAGTPPRDVGILVDMARTAAQRIARRNGMIG